MDSKSGSSVALLILWIYGSLFSGTAVSANNNMSIPGNETTENLPVPPFSSTTSESHGVTGPNLPTQTNLLEHDAATPIVVVSTGLPPPVNTPPPWMFQPMLVPICSSCLPPFIGGENFTRSITKWSNLVCGGSVCDKSYEIETCGPYQCDKCYCDEKCARLGDCCPDTYIRSPHQIPQVKLSCVSPAFITGDSQTSERYIMVSSCSDKHSAYRGACDSPDPLDLSANTPVYSPTTGLHYKNRACAACHDEINLQIWEANASCSALVDFSSVTSPRDLLDLLRLETRCSLDFTPPVNSDPRACSYDETMVTSCNTTGKWGEYDADVERACAMYTQPLVLGRPEVIYQNIFCAYCNGYDFYLEGCTNGLTIPGVARFSLLLDITSDQVTKDEPNGTKCKVHQTYDPFTDSCRRLRCGFGRIPERHTCIDLLPSAKGLGYVTRFGLYPRNARFVRVDNLDSFASRIFRNTMGQVSPLNPEAYSEFIQLTYQQEPNSSAFLVYGVDVQFSVYIQHGIPRNETEALLMGLLTRPWWNHEPFVYMDPVRVPDVSSDRLVVRSLSPNLLLPGLFGVNLSANYGFPGQFDEEAIPPEFMTDISAYIEITESMLCTGMYAVNKTEYIIATDGSPIIKKTGITLPKNRAVWVNGSLWICISSDNKWDSPIKEDDGSDVVEIWMTIICTNLSLLGLALTFAVYVIQKSAQSLPGKNSMCLFACLFLAQLLFLAGSGARVSPPACRTLGIIIHYFWLATFCWKLVCAFHIHKILTRPLAVVNKTRSFAVYVLFSFTAPILVIASIVSINVELTDSTAIGYADRKIGNNNRLCFLSSPMNVAFGFVLPVFLVVTVNLFLFGHIVYTLRQRPAIQKQNSRSNRKDSLIFMKMSLLFGFSWILGLVSLLVDLQGMWFLFTIVNSSIGVFVFISFGLKSLRAISLNACRRTHQRETSTPASRATPQTTATCSAT